jgi:hypothetical protein
MHVAIWKKRVLGYGKTVKEAYEMAKKKNPKAEPALAYIPEDEDDSMKEEFFHIRN